jgi:hypothetical protein
MRDATPLHSNAGQVLLGQALCDNPMNDLAQKQGHRIVL